MTVPAAVPKEDHDELRGIIERSLNHGPLLERVQARLLYLEQLAERMTGAPDDITNALRELQRRRASDDAKDARRLEWLAQAHGNLFTRGQSFRAETFHWYGDDGKSFKGDSLRELLDAAIDSSMGAEHG
jgi:hypothetical protein